jgi:hypothetical protein
MLTVRDITEALKKSRKAQADFTDHGKARKSRNTLTVKAKPAKQKSIRWELMAIRLTEVVGGRRLKSVPTTLLKAVELLDAETVQDALQKQLEYLPVPRHNAAFELEWAYTRG